MYRLYHIRDILFFLNYLVLHYLATCAGYLKNQQLTDKFIKLLKEIDPIKDKKLALPLQENSYEVLEFLGDAVIHAVIAEYLHRRYPDKDQGFLTKLRTKIENGQIYTEDVVVFNKLSSLGIKTYLDKTITCDHIGKTKYSGDFNGWSKANKY